MREPDPVLKEELFDDLPPCWADDCLREEISRQLRISNRCLVALDDDPTGTQTMHDIWVLTQWEVEDLVRALADGEPALYILTNSRSMSLDQAQKINAEIARNLIVASRATGRKITIVSRSDSTLRGHFPGEIDALAETLFDDERKPLDGICLAPVFIEGGRYTVYDIHWVQEGDMLVPAAQTAYAKDSVFGYRNSHLPSWVEEKTEGRIPSSMVISIPLTELREGGPQATAEILREVRGGQVIIVNAVDYRDLHVFIRALQAVEAEGKNFLFRTAASFVKAGAGLEQRSLMSPEAILRDRTVGGGLIVFGSHVPKSNAQLEMLQMLDGLDAVELQVPKILDGRMRQKAIRGVTESLDSALKAGRDALVFTSREVLTGSDTEASLAIGEVVSTALAEVVERLHHEPRYVIGKGGITSSDLAITGMHVRAARVLGQVIPGVPVWKTGRDSRWPGLPYVVFPGNVGADEAVADLVERFRIERA